MNKKLTKKTMFSEISRQYQLQMKSYKKKKFCFKAKLILTVILPVLILVLFIKTADTFIRIKLRDLFSKQIPPGEPKESGEPVSIHAIPVDPEIVHPQQVSGES